MVDRLELTEFQNYTFKSNGTDADTEQMCMKLIHPQVEGCREVYRPPPKLYSILHIWLMLPVDKQFQDHTRNIPSGCVFMQLRRRDMEGWKDSLAMMVDEENLIFMRFYGGGGLYVPIDSLSERGRSLEAHRQRLQMELLMTICDVSCGDTNLYFCKGWRVLILIPIGLLTSLYVCVWPSEYPTVAGGFVFADLRHPNEIPNPNRLLINHLHHLSYRHT